DAVGGPGTGTRRETEHGRRSLAGAVCETARSGSTASAGRACDSGKPAGRKRSLVHPVAGRTSSVHSNADGSGPRCAGLAAVAGGGGPSRAGDSFDACGAGGELHARGAPPPVARRTEAPARRLGTHCADDLIIADSPRRNHV